MKPASAVSSAKETRNVTMESSRAKAALMSFSERDEMARQIDVQDWRSVFHSLEERCCRHDDWGNGARDGKETMVGCLCVSGKLLVLGAEMSAILGLKRIPRER